MIFFSPKNCPIFFGPLQIWGRGGRTHRPNLYVIYNLLPLTTIQNMKCLAFLEVF